MAENPKLVVAITGASGGIYAIRLLEQIVEQYARIYLTVTPNGLKVMRSELDLELDGGDLSVKALLGADSPNVTVCASDDITAPPASGSVVHDGMVIVPCSTGTVGRIASGAANDLVTRAADVCLKERRKLILVVRETPLSVVHLRNLTALAEAGAVILPAMPGFYNRPSCVDDLVSFVVARILQHLGIPQSVSPEWKATEE